jgi:hypothetical protein
MDYKKIFANYVCNRGIISETREIHTTKLQKTTTKKLIRKHRT